MNSFKVLVVDDNELIIKVLKDNFELFAENYLIYGCTKSKNAVELIKNNTYDFLLLDYFIDEMTAITLIKEIRKYKDKVPIWILTGHMEEIIDIKECLNIQGIIEKNGNFNLLFKNILKNFTNYTL